MGFLLFHLFHRLEHRPSIGYVASAGTAAMGYVGQFLAQAAQITTPAVIRWAGYVTVIASAVGAIATAVIQIYRLRREARGIFSRHPFERKNDHRPD